MAGWWPGLLLVACALASRLLTAPGAVESLDGLLFVRGVERYSVLEARPHWPGYPVYIGLAKLLNGLSGDPEASLRLLSILASSLSLVPIMALVYDWRRSAGRSPEGARQGAFIAGLLWALAPASWIVGTEIGSDPMGLLLALVVLWCCSRSWLLPHGSSNHLLAAGLLSGLLLGVRLPYGALLLPFGAAVWKRLRSARRPGAGPQLAAAFWIPALVVPVAGWLAWQLWMDGPGFLDVARARLAAHYGNWTERVIAHGNWYRRPATLGEIVVVHGAGGWWPGLPATRLPATAAWLALVLAGGRRLLATPGPRRLLLAWTLPYILVILLFNDVSLARYGLPLVAGLCLLGGVGAPEGVTRGGWVAVVVALALAAVTLPLAWEHRRDPPPAVQWVRFLKDHYDPARSAVAVTPQAPFVGLVLEQYAPAFPREAVSPPRMQAFVAAREAEGRRVYATSPDPWAPQDWTPVACFTRNRLLQSRGPWELWLYEHGRAAEARRISCRPHGEQDPPGRRVIEDTATAAPHRVR